MQTVVYGRLVTGVAKETGKPYNFVELSDGFAAFSASYNPDLREELENMKRGQQFTGEFTIAPGYKGLSATLESIEQ